VTCAWPPNRLERGFRPPVTFHKVTRGRAHDVAQQLIFAQDITLKTSQRRLRLAINWGMNLCTAPFQFHPIRFCFVLRRHYTVDLRSRIDSFLHTVCKYPIWFGPNHEAEARSPFSGCEHSMLCRPPYNPYARSMRISSIFPGSFRRKKSKAVIWVESNVIRL
jgi:hypothetical protein